MSNFSEKKGTITSKKKISIVSICQFKITALGIKNIGMDDRSKNYSVLIPNAKLGQIVKAKILKINLKNNKYIIAKLIQVVKKNTLNKKKTLITLKPGDSLVLNDLKVNKKGAGVVELEKNYKLIIPNATIEKNPVNVKITRIKSEYAFGQIINNLNFGKNSLGLNSNSETDLKFSIDENKKQEVENKFVQGTKLTLTIPKKVKKYANYLIFKVRGLLIFIKLNLTAKIGNTIRIKLTKIHSTFAIAKILKINPPSLIKKHKLIKYSISQMLKNGVHLGEKASKCNAKMKNYIWLRKHQKNKKDHHTINLLKTHRCLNKALSRLTKYAFKGRNFLFIGTKQAAASLIERASVLTKNSFFVNTRWLGGMLTNWKTIFKSIFKIEPILSEKQDIVRQILQKRNKIKSKLLQKLYLRQKNIFNKFLTNKNQHLIKQLKNPQFSSFLLEQLENRKQILNLINQLKKDKKSLKKLILEKQLENRLLTYKTVDLNQDNSINNNLETKIKENETFIQLANNTRNHIKIILNFVLAKKINSKTFNKSFIQLIKSHGNSLKENLKGHNELGTNKTEKKLIKKTTTSLTRAERNIKKLFKFLSEQKQLSSLGLSVNNLKQIFLLKKLLKLLPSLKRSIKISQTKLNQSVEIYMKKIVDRRLRHSFKKIFNYVYKNYLFANSKKIASSLKKKWKRLEKYLGGISNMIKISKKTIYKNIAIVIGQKEEMNAVRECRKLGLEMFHIVDTNCNPTFADHRIPANDDSNGSIKYILNKFLLRIRLAQKLKRNMEFKSFKNLRTLSKTKKKLK